MIAWSCTSSVIRNTRSAPIARAAPQLPAAQIPVTLPPAPDLGGADPRRSYNAASLAYLGDAIWEVYIRSAFLELRANRAPISTQAQQLVNTHAQAACYALLQSLAAADNSSRRSSSSSSPAAPAANCTSPVPPDKPTTNSPTAAAATPPPPAARVDTQADGAAAAGTAQVPADPAGGPSTNAAAAAVAVADAGSLSSSGSDAGGTGRCTSPSPPLPAATPTADTSETAAAAAVAAASLLAPPGPASAGTAAAAPPPAAAAAPGSGWLAPVLTPNELSVLRWAANSTTNSPPVHATRQQYKQATAVEALVGYWYLTDATRLHYVLGWLLQPQQLQQWAPQQQGQQQRGRQRQQATRQKQPREESRGAQQPKQTLAGRRGRQEQ